MRPHFTAIVLVAFCTLFALHHYLASEAATTFFQQKPLDYRTYAYFQNEFVLDVQRPYHARYARSTQMAIDTYREAWLAMRINASSWLVAFYESRAGAFSYLSNALNAIYQMLRPPKGPTPVHLLAARSWPYNSMFDWFDDFSADAPSPFVLTDGVLARKPLLNKIDGSLFPASLDVAYLESLASKEGWFHVAFNKVTNESTYFHETFQVVFEMSLLSFSSHLVCTFSSNVARFLVLLMDGDVFDTSFGLDGGWHSGK